MSIGTLVARNMLVVVIGKGMTITLGVFTFALLARHLGTSGLGDYRTILTLLTLAAVCADLGIYAITLREISRGGADQSALLGNAVALRLVTTSFVLFLATGAVLLTPYQVIIPLGMLVGIVGWTAYQTHELLIAVFQRKLKQGQAMTAEVTGAAVTLTLVALLAQSGNGPLAMIFAMTLGHLATLTASWSLARRLVPFRLRFDWPVWRRLAMAGLPIAGSGILGMLILRGDTLLLSLLKSPEDVGIYGVASKIFEIFTTLPYLFAGLMLPLFTGSAHTDLGRFRSYLDKSLATVTAVSVAVVVVLWSFSLEVALLLAGTAFEAAAMPLRILGLAMALASFSLLLRFAATALERQLPMLWADGLGVAIALVSYLLLIPRFSYVGAAWSTTLVEGIIMLCAAVIVWRGGGRFAVWPSVVKSLLAGSIMAAIFFTLKQFGVWWMLSLAVGTASYVAALVLLGALPRQFLFSLLSPAIARESRPGNP